jgi:hypothetical protein
LAWDIKAKKGVGTDGLKKKLGYKSILQKAGQEIPHFLGTHEIQYGGSKTPNPAVTFRQLNSFHNQPLETSSVFILKLCNISNSHPIARPNFKKLTIPPHRRGRQQSVCRDPPHAHHANIPSAAPMNY